MKPRKLFYLLSKTKTKQEFIQVLKENRPPLSMDNHKKIYDSLSNIQKNQKNVKLIIYMKEH